MGNQCTCFNSPNNQPTQNLSQLQNPLNLNKNMRIDNENNNKENDFNKQNENNFIFEDEKTFSKIDEMNLKKNNNRYQNENEDNRNNNNNDNFNNDDNFNNNDNFNNDDNFNNNFNIDKNINMEFYANKLNRYVRGYLNRKKYQKEIKNTLKNFENTIYNEFITKISKNEKVENTLKNPEKNQTLEKYLTLNYIYFYPSSNYEDLNEKINLKKLYNNAIKITYNSNYNYSNEIQDILKNISSLYKGTVDLYSNKKNGFGIEIFRDGSQKQGNFYEDSFTGFNKFIDSSGTLYVGNFINNMLNGKGIKYNKDSNHIYEGNFNNFLRDGEGFENINGTQYNGNFKEDKKCGRGKINFENGDYFSGEFNENVFDGEGHYKWKNGEEYVGQYKSGKFNGKGKYIWNEKKFYVGDYINGIKEGNGEITFEDGRKFVCPFVNGKPHGIGFYYKGNQKREVEFINGKINKNYKKNNHTTNNNNIFIENN